MPKREHEIVDNQTLEIQDEEDLVCGACLLELFDQSNKFIAIPSGCPHLFHWDCLENWAERQNTCPQCKNRFRHAGKYCGKDRELIECVKFKKRNRVSDPDESEEEVMVDICERCKEPGADEDLILCDGMDFTCNAMYHYRCVGFSKVPSGLWFCDTCTEKGYIPEELKAAEIKRRRIIETSQKREEVPKRNSKQDFQSTPLFPKRLLVLEGATRRPPERSSQLPRSLVLESSSPIQPPTSVSRDDVSVFARFRARRLALKRND